MAKEVTRYIKKETERELWARSAGRCEFDGCNRLLYKSPVTQEQVNIAEKAHIYSFSEKGPRGWGRLIFNKKELNQLGNLMLMCHDCHKTIDQDKEGVKYTAELLQSWKTEHENRITIVTGVTTDKKTHIVFYGSNIEEQRSPIQKLEAMEAVFPNRYPVNENPILLSMKCSHEDKFPEFWSTESMHLLRAFNEKILPIIEGGNIVHFSIFALAPIPLLIQLGALFTDKISVDVYQPIREPKTWRWQQEQNGFEFIINEPKDFEGKPALVFSLSDKIFSDRITSVADENLSIWEVTVGDQYRHNDFIKSPTQLSQFRSIMRNLMGDIKEKHGQKTPLMIFPAMPVSCSIELGRIRMPKADMPWHIFDQNNKAGQFIKTISLGEAL